MTDRDPPVPTHGPADTGERRLAPGLYLVATPIGNLADMSRRAVDTLAAADIVACEDTRVTRRLLTSFGATAKLTPYHEHNAARAAPQLLRRLAAGDTVALVSDAGQPLVSDPGYRLVRGAVAAGVPVCAVPGACAAVIALAVSGLPTDRFHFAGFAPSKAAARRTFVRALAAIDATLIVYESPRRLAACLADLAAGLGDRPAAVARELTKRHEEVRRGSLGALAAHYADAPPRGEVTVVVAPPPAGERHAAADDEAGRAVAELVRLALGRHSVRDAANLIAVATGRPKSDVYRLALAEKARADDDAAP